MRNLIVFGFSILLSVFSVSSQANDSVDHLLNPVQETRLNNSSSVSSGHGDGGYHNDCGTYEVCGWTPGWHCLNNHHYRSECCWDAQDSNCGGSGGGNSSHSCGTYEVCGWTPGWHCLNNHHYRSECCWDAHDSNCTGY